MLYLRAFACKINCTCGQLRFGDAQLISFVYFRLSRAVASNLTLNNMNNVKLPVDR